MRKRWEQIAFYDFDLLEWQKLTLDNKIYFGKNVFSNVEPEPASNGDAKEFGLLGGI